MSDLLKLHYLTSCINIPSCTWHAVYPGTSIGSVHMSPTQKHVNHFTDKLVFRFNTLRCDNCHKTIFSK